MPKFIKQEDVLWLHNRQINQFGGTTGIRDEGLLISALAQPRATFGGKLLHSTFAEQAAAYLYHIAMNHPFVDGNKRTAFAAMDAFVRLNGFRLTATADEAYSLVIRTVTREIDKPQLAEEISSKLVQTSF